MQSGSVGSAGAPGQPPQETAAVEKKRSGGSRNPKLEQLELELADARANREALRSKQVPNFFSFPLGKELILARAPDMDKLARDLGVFSRRGPGDSSERSSAPSAASDRDLSDRPERAETHEKPEKAAKAENGGKRLQKENRQARAEREDKRQRLAAATETHHPLLFGLQLSTSHPPSLLNRITPHELVEYAFVYLTD